MPSISPLTNSSGISSTRYGTMPRPSERSEPNNWQFLRECLRPILWSIGGVILMLSAAKELSKSEKESEVIGQAIDYSFGALMIVCLPLHTLASFLSNRSGYSSWSSDSSSDAWFYHGGDFSSGHYGDGGGGVGDGGAC